LPRKIQTLPATMEEEHRAASGAAPIRDGQARIEIETRRGIRPCPHLERDSGRDEPSSMRVSKSEAPRSVADGLARRPTAANGAKDLAYQPLDAGRRALAKAQDDVDAGGRRLLPLAPDVPIDLRPQGAMPRQRPFLSFSCPTIGSIRGRVRHVRTGFDPVVTLGSGADHGGTSCWQFSGHDAARGRTGAAWEGSNGRAEEKPNLFRNLPSAGGGTDQVSDQSLTTTSASFSVDQDATPVRYAASR
jgi:hypothetical protein